MLEVDRASSARLRLVTVQNPGGLEKEGHFLFRATQASGAQRVAPVRLETESLEQANVSVVRGMTEIVTTTRTFDAIERMIDAFKDAERRAAMEIASSK
jgi:flagellar basal body rod protein FlgG